MIDFHKWCVWDLNPKSTKVWGDRQPARSTQFGPQLAANRFFCSWPDVCKYTSLSIQLYWLCMYFRPTRLCLLESWFRFAEIHKWLPVDQWQVGCLAASVSMFMFVFQTWITCQRIISPSLPDVKYKQCLQQKSGDSFNAPPTQFQTVAKDMWRTYAEAFILLLGFINLKKIILIILSSQEEECSTRKQQKKKINGNAHAHCPTSAAQRFSYSGIFLRCAPFRSILLEGCYLVGWTWVGLVGGGGWSGLGGEGHTSYTEPGAEQRPTAHLLWSGTGAFTVQDKFNKSVKKRQTCPLFSIPHF